MSKTTLKHPSTFMRRAHAVAALADFATVGPAVVQEGAVFRLVVETSKPLACLKWLHRQQPGIRWEVTEVPTDE